MTEAAIVERSAPPLSVAQEALWYASRLAPNRISYNETISIRKDGPLDPDAFRRAFNEIVNRHEAWRTTFDTVAGEPVQVVHPPVGFDLPVLDLSHLSPEAAERRAIQVISEVARIPFDIRRGPLLRPRLVRFPEEHHRLYLALHHLIFDGASVNRVVLPELVALYDAYRAREASPLTQSPPQYTDYARWEQHWITEPRVARRLEYWRRRLDGAPPLSLPLDHARPDAARLRGGMLPLTLPREAVDRLRAIGQESGATLFQVLATIWAMLLSRYSGQQEVVFATVANLRQRPELISVVGYGVTPVVLRVDLAGAPTVAELVVRVRNELLDALDHLVPFERVVRELHAGVSSSANPIYQTMLVLEPAMVTPDRSWSMHQFETEVGDAVGNTKLDLELQLDERPDGHISGRLIYDRDLFEPDTVSRLAEHWLHLAAGAGSDPRATAARLPILTATETKRQLKEWNATATERRQPSITDLIRGWAMHRPEAPAVVADGEAINYGELERRATQVAQRLLAADVRTGDVVALCASPSVGLVAGALGILKAGAACVLIDPELPSEPRDTRLDACGAAAVLAPVALCGGLDDRGMRALALDETQSAARIGPPLPEVTDPGATCLVQYVSDRAGGGAGVILSHRSVANLTSALAAELGIGPADVVLALPAGVFDCSAVELWLALTAGASLVVAPPGTAADGARLASVIAAEGVTFVHASPGIWRGLIDTGLRAVRGLRALSGGGPLSAELAGEILDRCRVLWNAYGVPETTWYCTLGRVEPAAPVTIGRPLANTRVYVLDGYGQPVPVGVPGELVVAGEGVANGYGNRFELNDAAFVPEPFGGAGGAYRTGDRVRWLPDGSVEPVGPTAALP